MVQQNEKAVIANVYAVKTVMAKKVTESYCWW
jgi:hypothetical protein